MSKLSDVGLVRPPPRASRPPLVLVAHGTRSEAGTELIGRLADAVGRRLPGVTVRPAFVDVRRPSVADALAELSRLPGPAIVVPAFLAAGYHVREDLPAQLAAAVPGGDALLTPLLGADPLVVAAAADRLYRAGWRPGDAVVLGAAGSKDPRARADLVAAADTLAIRLGTEVHPGYLASGEPSAVEEIASLRRSGRRVAAASWLLAPGLFHRRLAESGAEVVADPLGAHAAVVRALVGRYRSALPGRGPGTVAGVGDPGPLDRPADRGRIARVPTRLPPGQARRQAGLQHHPGRRGRLAFPGHR